MAKDAKGHGSDTGTKGMRLIKTHTMGPHSAKVYNNPEWGEKVVKTFFNGQYQPKNDYHTDDVADAHGTAQSQLKRWADQDAASSLSSGTPKSASVPVSHGMASSDAVNRAIKASPTGRIDGRQAHDASRAYEDRHNEDIRHIARAGSNRRTKIGSGI